MEDHKHNPNKMVIWNSGGVFISAANRWKDGRQQRVSGWMETSSIARFARWSTQLHGRLVADEARISCIRSFIHSFSSSFTSFYCSMTKCTQTTCPRLLHGVHTAGSSAQSSDTNQLCYWIAMTYGRSHMWMVTDSSVRHDLSQCVEEITTCPLKITPD